jgi:hypothetical protein
MGRTNQSSGRSKPAKTKSGKKKKSMWGMLTSFASDRHHNLHLTEGRGKLATTTTQTTTQSSSSTTASGEEQTSESSSEEGGASGDGSESSEEKREEKEYQVAEKSDGEVTEPFDDDSDVEKDGDEDREKDQENEAKDEKEGEEEGEEKEGEEREKDDEENDKGKEKEDEKRDENENGGDKESDEEKKPAIEEQRDAPKQHVRVAAMGWLTGVDESAHRSDVRRMVRERARDSNKPDSARALEQLAKAKSAREVAVAAVQQIQPGMKKKARTQAVNEAFRQARAAVNEARLAAEAAQKAVSEAAPEDVAAAKDAAAKAGTAVEQAAQALANAKKAWPSRLERLILGSNELDQRAAAVVAELTRALGRADEAEDLIKLAATISGSLDPLDMSARIALLAEMLEQADKNAPAGAAEDNARIGGGKVMRVFAAPEWLFRRPDRPLTTAEAVRILEELEALAEKYKDWVIVPGTLFYTTSAPGSPVYDVYNIAPVFHDGKSRILTKQNDQDYLVTEADRVKDLSKTLERWAAGDSGSFSSAFFRSKDGLRYAIEICRDHNQRVALSQSGLQTVDVQILVANGQGLQESSIVARDGGIVIHVDGAGGRAAAYLVERDRPLESLRESYEALEDAQRRKDDLAATVGDLLDAWDTANQEGLRLKKTPASAERDEQIADRERIAKELLVQIRARQPALDELSKEIEALVKELKSHVKLRELYKRDGTDWIPDALLDLKPDRFAPS